MDIIGGWLLKMPKYRKLHTKITESLDMNDMPTDFARLTWALLPLALCREGRGLYNMSWIKSKIHPLRTDIKEKDMQEAFDWYQERGMIVVYHVRGRDYFNIPTWHEYQGETTREADSIYPSPEEAETTQELRKSRSNQSSVKRVLNLPVNIESESTCESNKNGTKKNDPLIPEELDTPEFRGVWKEWTKHRKEIKKPLTPTTIKSQLKKLSKYTDVVAAAMLEQSIEHGWQGIWELKEDARASPRDSTLDAIDRVAAEMEAERKLEND
jgi:hypothetical protein